MSAKPNKGKAYKLFDGGGLYVEILPHGSKLWRIKYRYMGAERRISLGAYPIVTLADARDRRTEIKRLLTEDMDPAQAKQQKKQEIVRNAENTFKAVALEWFEIKKSEITPGYAEKIKRRIMMQEWADFLSGMLSEGKVIKAKFAS